MGTNYHSRVVIQASNEVIRIMCNSLCDKSECNDEHGNGTYVANSLIGSKFTNTGKWTPEDVIVKLSKLYPTVPIRLDTFSEYGEMRVAIYLEGIGINGDWALEAFPKPAKLKLGLKNIKKRRAKDEKTEKLARARALREEADRLEQSV